MSGVVVALRHAPTPCLSEQVARVSAVITGEIASMASDRRDSIRVARLFTRQAALYAGWLQPLETAESLRALADELEALA